MSAGEEETKAQELVIIRRPNGGEDAPHKGGVWKIAYADFMTAMMAFFLVMWLINAADKQTLTQVATYFNPLHLTDKVALTKGVHQSESAAQSEEKKSGNPKPPSGAKDANEKQPESAKHEPNKGKGESKASGAKPKYTDEVLFRDPYGVLTKLAKEAADEQAQAAKGNAFRDPFDPAFRRETHAGKEQSARAAPTPSPAAAQASARPGDTGAGAEAQSAEVPPAPAQPATRPPDAKSKLASADAEAPPPGVESKTPANSPGALPEAGEPKPSASSPPPLPPAQPADGARNQNEKQASIDAIAPPPGVESKTPGRSPGPLPELADPEQSAVSRLPPAAAPALDEVQARRAEREAAERATAEKLEHDIRQVIARAIAGALPNITVTVTAEGLLISLTDDQNFGMFAVGSAEPRPAMVLLMEKLGKVIGGYAEPLVVRGYTDGRPYKSGSYDNWRLSTARAHMAYYMLIRGGVDEKRFERIEGFADRNLKIPAEPEAAENRRIEILLRRPKS